MKTAPSIPARPTTYRGITMRSRLEARYAAWLDRAGVTWRYEPQCFAGHGGQYLPDFELVDVRCSFPQTTEAVALTMYVDVKPASWRSSAAAAELLDRMTVIWETNPRAVLALEVEHAPCVFLGSRRSEAPHLGVHVGQWWWHPDGTRPAEVVIHGGRPRDTRDVWTVR